MDLDSLLPHDRLLGLAEMMNFPGVLMAFPEVTDKLLLFRQRVIDGHAPQLAGEALNAYAATGITSDHECTLLAEAREKLSKGLSVMLRQGSQSKDLANLLPLVDDYTWPHCMFVSDDLHPDDLLRNGHMNAIVNRATSLGMEPVRAISLATLTPARHFGLTRRGAIAPGYRADFSLSPTLNPWQPRHVFKQGIEVAREGRLLADTNSWASPAAPSSPMRITTLTAQDLAVPAQQGNLRIIGVREGTLLTEKIVLPPAIEGGCVVQDTSRDILKLAVYNRYVPGNPPAVAFARGFGLRQGAIAATVAHDSHNLIAVGATDEDIVHVADAVRKSGGGMAIGRKGDDVLVLPLPIAGLMSDRSVAEVASRLDELKARARAWGSALENPFMALSFLALPVIPELKLTDRGLIDVLGFSIVSLFEQP